MNFLEKFTGLIIAAEKEDEETSTVKFHFNFDYIILSVFLIFISMYAIIRTSDYFTFFYFFLSILGVIISVIIIKQEFGSYTLVGNIFCLRNDGKESVVMF